MNIKQPRNERNRDTQRGQAYIGEALFAIILLSGVVFLATTTLAIDEPSLSADDRERQAEIKADAQQLVELSKQDGSLKSSVLDWDADREAYVNTTNVDGVHFELPYDPFGDRMNELSLRQNVGVNVNLIPARNASNEGSTLNRTRPDPVGYIVAGDAGNTMVTVETQITLYGGDRLQSPSRAHRTGHTPSMTDAGEETLADVQDSFPIPPATDSVDDDGVYNVVTVRVVLWF